MQVELQLTKERGPMTLLSFFSLGGKQPLPRKKKSTVLDLTKARSSPRGKKNQDAPPPPITRKGKVGRPSISSPSVQKRVCSLQNKVKVKASGALATTPEKRRKWSGPVGLSWMCV